MGEGREIPRRKERELLTRPRACTQAPRNSGMLRISAASLRKWARHADDVVQAERNERLAALETCSLHNPNGQGTA